MKRKATPTPILIDKSEFADEIAAAMPCQDEAAAYVDYDRENTLIGPDGKHRQDTEGHTWNAWIIDHSGGMWFDDREGDIRLQIADAIELRGNLLLSYAKHLRQHAKGKPIG
jgi:hypothetical protein